MALASMTGFSRVDGTHADARWTWELRSVNGKGLDMRLRLPHGRKASIRWSAPSHVST